MEELKDARRKINIIRGQRRRTNELLKLQQREKLEEGLQSAKRKIRRFVTATSKEKEEKKMWKNAEKYVEKRLSFESQEDESVSSIFSSDTSSSIGISPETDNNDIEEVTTSFLNTEISSNIPATAPSGDDDWEFGYD